MSNEYQEKFVLDAECSKKVKLASYVRKSIKIAQDIGSSKVSTKNFERIEAYCNLIGLSLKKIEKENEAPSIKELNKMRNEQKIMFENFLRDISNMIDNSNIAKQFTYEKFLAPTTLPLESEINDNSKHCYLNPKKEASFYKFYLHYKLISDVNNNHE